MPIGYSAILTETFAIHAGTPPHSTDLANTASSFPITPTLVGTGLSRPAGGGLPSIISVLHQDRTKATWGDQHDSRWFEKIHVEPRVRDLGFVLSSQTFTVLVWNAYRYRAKTIGALPITGTSGIAFDNAPPLPQHLPATDQFSYTILLDASGSPFIENLITWDFNPDEAGTNLEVSGTRLIPFPFEANQADPISQGIGFLTDVMFSKNRKEQRAKLRSVPQYSLEYSILNEKEIDAQLCQALLYGWQTRAYGVPLWQDAQQLQVDAAANQTVIQLPSTANRDFVVGGLLLLWNSAHVWEILTILTINPTNIVVTTNLKSNWLAYTTYVMPMQLGRLTPLEDLTWVNTNMSTMRVAFTMEATLP